MPLVWQLLLGLLLILLLYGDVRARHSPYISPEKAAALGFSKWPVWKTIEPVNSRFRVLWIDQDYVPWVNAGSEICTHTINKFLMKKPYKWDVWVAAPGCPRKTYEGIRCFDLHDTKTLFEVLGSTHIIQSHSYPYRKSLLYISRVTGIPFVEWAHTDNYVGAVKRDYKTWNATQSAQWTVFNSNSLMKSAGKDIPNSKVFIPIVDYRDYAIESKRRDPQYVTLSNVNYNKGGDLLIQLARALPDMQFLGVIGGYRKQITNDELPNLTYIPHTNRIKDIYSKTWVQIMPSKEETWGRTAVEAMSSGIPVVVSPTPGLRECCGGAAVYVDRSDLDGWVASLRKLKDDPEFYNRRSKVALERARALDPRPVCNQIEDWLEQSVLKSAKPGRPLGWFEKNLLFR